MIRSTAPSLRATPRLAAGRPLLNLKECFATVPLDEKGRPRLAIARADRRTVELSERWRENLVVFDTRKNGASNSTLRIEVEVPPFAERVYARSYALVPLIPAAMRTKFPRGTRDAMCHILWEVEKWSDDRPLGAHADGDPYLLLLMYLGGDLWTVLAEWGLQVRPTRWTLIQPRRGATDPCGHGQNRGPASR